MTSFKWKQSRPGTTRRVRLAGYDYASTGFYFVTICTYDRQSYFGEIENDVMQLSRAGQMISKTILEIEDRFQTVSIDAFEVMPNHVHLLIGIAVRLSDPTDNENLSDIVQWFKTTTHQRYRAGVRTQGWEPYKSAVWQKGFHDHIVRNEKELETLRRYVATNVESWGRDRFYDGLQ